jgi:cytochrome c oxidase assembly protein subunit 15
MNVIPTQGKKPILIWLYTGMIMIIIMIAIGGITRLTHSGLSMVDWKPIMGTIPPITNADWEASFEKYKAFPEYQIVNYDMDLSEYKEIFFWEYLHRLWGRIMGFVFIIPFIAFWRKKYLPGPWVKRFIWIVIGGGLVGALGWFMVVSGLKEKPAVSHYRLAIHLIAAFTLLAYIYWQSLKVKYGESSIKTNATSFSLWLIIITYVQIIYGAFVAGLKAGLIHNTFPLMGDSLMHENTFSLSPFWENLVQHADGVQFIHRNIAYLVVILILIFGLKYWGKISQKMDQSLKITFVLVIIQFLLGVTTLLLKVPVSLGVLHQIGAILLLLSLFRLRFFSIYS